MHAKLVSYSQPSEEVLKEGLHNVQDLIAFCARVSNPSNQLNTETSEKLLNYLAKHKHWSPFEMTSACIEVETTRDIARQLLRHRSFSFQEFSQRYADPTQLDFAQREARLQDKKNRQNSIEIDVKIPEEGYLQYLFERAQDNVSRVAEDNYNFMIDKGIAKEQARALLPEGLMMSRLYMAGSLRSWIHYCELRMSNGTQKEHMEIAKECWSIIEKEFPNVAKAIH